MPKLEISLLGRALRLLSRREHSRQELRKKLLPYAEDPTELENLLDKLEKDKWLSNDRYAESLVRRKSERFGTLHIIDELKQQSISTETIERLKLTLRESEPERAWGLWSKKYGPDFQTEPKERAKQIRYLASKGFSMDLILKVVSGRYHPEIDQ
jgi:regulatory protein